MSIKNNFPFSLNPKAFILPFLLITYIINFVHSSTCSKDQLITDKTCFNDVLRFNNQKYRAGHFVTYKNKDVIAEFSGDSVDSDRLHRIFYGLKANGRFYFENDSPTYEIEDIGKIDDARGRYESLNLLVVTENDLTRENEFLFSTSSYDSLTELHIINNKSYARTKTTSFVNHIIFSFQYDMVEIEYNSKIFYFLAFTYSSASNRNGDYIDIKKFGFKSFSFADINTYNNKVTTITDNHDNKIVNLFALKDLTTLVLVYTKKSNNQITLKFYDYDLNSQGSDISLGSINIVDPNNRDKDGVFFKSVELPENKRAFMIYYSGNANELYLNIYQFDKNGNSILLIKYPSHMTSYLSIIFYFYNHYYSL